MHVEPDLEPLEESARPNPEQAGSLDGDALTEGDALASEILKDLAPLTFTEALTEAEQDACFRLRYRAVVEVAMADTANFPAGLERDAFDSEAIQIIGTDGADCIGTCRIVLPRPGRLLPMEMEFGRTTTASRSDLVEWGRLVVAPEYRGDGQSVLLGLAARGWLAMRSRRFTSALAVTPKRLMALFEALGFAVHTLGPPRLYWGVERHPILFGIRGSIEGVSAAWGEFGPPG